MDKGFKVHTLTNSINQENPFGKKIEIFPYNFDNPKKLQKSLEGDDVLYNAYCGLLSVKTPPVGTVRGKIKLSE